MSSHVYSNVTLMYSYVSSYVTRTYSHVAPMYSDVTLMYDTRMYTYISVYYTYVIVWCFSHDPTRGPDHSNALLKVFVFLALKENEAIFFSRLRFFNENVFEEIPPEHLKHTTASLNDHPLYSFVVSREYVLILFRSRLFSDHFETETSCMYRVKNSLIEESTCLHPSNLRSFQFLQKYCFFYGEADGVFLFFCRF